MSSLVRRRDPILSQMAHHGCMSKFSRRQKRSFPQVLRLARPTIRKLLSSANEIDPTCISLVNESGSKGGVPCIQRHQATGAEDLGKSRTVRMCLPLHLSIIPSERRRATNSWGGQQAAVKIPKEDNCVPVWNLHQLLLQSCPKVGTSPQTLLVT